MDIRDILDSNLLRPRNLIPAGIAVVFAVVSWFGIQDFLFGEELPAEPVPVMPEPEVAEPAPPPPEPVEEPPPVDDTTPVFPKLLVAKRDIKSGVMLADELLEWQEWQKPVDLSMAVLQDSVSVRAVVGSVARRPYEAGTPIGWDGIITPGGPGFIGAVLTPGMRAVTVEVDRATTNANIIYPGDRVDVVMVSEKGSGPTPEPAAQAIVLDARVLAVGSTVVSLGRYASVSLETGGVIQPVRSPSGDSYTLEVLPVDAERIALAAATGRLTLAMRRVSAEPVGDPGTRRAVRLTEVIVEPAPPPVPPAAAPVRILRGNGTDDSVSTES